LAYQKKKMKLVHNIINLIILVILIPGSGN